MKISFFRSIGFRTLVYCISIIMLTMALIYVIHITIVRKEIEKDRLEKISTETSLMAGKIQDRLNNGESLEDMAGPMNMGPQGGKDEIRKHAPGDGGGRNFFILTDITGKPLFDGRGNEPHQNFRFTAHEIDVLKTGAMVKSSFRDDRGPGMMFFIALPLTAGNRTVGSLVAFDGFPPPPKMENMVKTSVLQALLISLLVSSVAALLFSRNLTMPLRLMESAAKRAAVGDFSVRMNLKRGDELGSLATSFDHMTSRLEAYIKSRTQMMGDISHELATPLTAIHGAAEAMLDGIIEDDAERKKCLTNILRQVKQLSFLIDDITELSKFETGEIKIKKEIFSAVSPIAAAVDSARIVAMKKDISVIALAGDEGIKVIGDPRRIVQALQNLIHNAIVHNPPGTEIRVLMKKEGDKVLFAVEDNGKAIPEKELEHIFERFYKVDKSRARGPQGAGLGLAIVKEILSAHHSAISVCPAAEGKRFSFYLPAAQPGKYDLSVMPERA